MDNNSDRQKLFVTDADRMNGFKLYLSNTSIIPPEGPEGYLCYNDTEPGLPNITQTLSCNHLGQYVIYYQDSKGSLIGNESYNIIELCYVAIHGELCFRVYVHMLKNIFVFLLFNTWSTP